MAVVMVDSNDCVLPPRPFSFGNRCAMRVLAIQPGLVGVCILLGCRGWAVDVLGSVKLFHRVGIGPKDALNIVVLHELVHWAGEVHESDLGWEWNAFLLPVLLSVK